jgi:hypothetical protein
MRHNQQNMKVTIQTTKLLEALKANKEQHVKDFAAAKESYFKQLKKIISTYNKDIKEGNLRKDSYKHKLHQPIDMSAEYDKYIGMLELAEETEHTISTEQYDEYINDSWGWVSTSKTVNSMYLMND